MVSETLSKRIYGFVRLGLDKCPMFLYTWDIKKGTVMYFEIDKTVEEKAISLLKEIRIISGINSRKSNICDKCKNEFKFINHTIDEFKNRFKLEGFKK